MRRAAAGAGRTAPIVLGYAPVAFAYGVLARQAGLSEINTVLMSLLVYAGASQFVAVGLFGAGASPAAVIMTTFIVNLRHLVLSSALAPYLSRWKTGRLAAFGFQVTDETFALHAARFAAGDVSPTEAFSANVTAQTSWVAGTILGVLAGRGAADVRPLGLDFALPALFIALLTVSVRSRSQAAAAALAGLLSTTFILLGMDRWSVVAATLIAAGGGMVLQPWIKKRYS